MSSSYKTLKRKIEQAAEGESSMTRKQLDDLIYQKYNADKITADEYDRLYYMLETRF